MMWRAPGSVTTRVVSAGSWLASSSTTGSGQTGSSSPARTRTGHRTAPITLQGSKLETYACDLHDVCGPGSEVHANPDGELAGGCWAVRAARPGPQAGAADDLVISWTGRSPVGGGERPCPGSRGQSW